MSQLTIHPFLPPEILELFIDGLGTQSLSDSEIRHALENCSLVSRAFRNRAHHHLFSKIEFVQPPYSTPSNILSRLWKFQELINAGLELPLTTLLYHTRSFKLVMDGSMFEAYAILENEDLVCIMRLLQIHSWDLRAIVMQGSSFPIIWPDLTWNFRTAFKELCQCSASLTTLCLENIIGVPHTLLLGTKIKHVCFHLIEFAKSSTDLLPAFRQNHFLQGQLESIDIDYTFPFLIDITDALETRHEASMVQYQSIFSHVKSLKYLIYRSDDLQRFFAVAQNISSTLEVVDLELSNSDNGFLRALSWEIPFDRLHNIRRLLLRHKSLISVGTRHPLIKVAAILRNMVVPRSLETVEITFEVRALPPWLKTPHFFPEPRSWALLDRALIHEKFELVTTVAFNIKYFTIRAPPWTFDERIFAERCRASIQDVLPMLSSSKTKRLLVNISASPGFGDADGLTFQSDP